MFVPDDGATRCIEDVEVAILIEIRQRDAVGDVGGIEAPLRAVLVESPIAAIAADGLGLWVRVA